MGEKWKVVKKGVSELYYEFRSEDHTHQGLQLSSLAHAILTVMDEVEELMPIDRSNPEESIEGESRLERRFREIGEKIQKGMGQDLWHRELRMLIAEVKERWPLETFEYKEPTNLTKEQYRIRYEEAAHKLLGAIKWYMEWLFDEQGQDKQI